MYYIVNQTHQIIAADSSLLELLAVENIDELYTKIALGDIKFSYPSSKEIIITTLKGEESFDTKINTLSGMLGDITLIQVQALEEIQENAAPIEESIEDLLIVGTNIKEDEVSIPNNISEEIDNIADDSVSFDEMAEDLLEKTSEQEEEISLIDDEPITFDNKTEVVLEEGEQKEEMPLIDELISFDNKTEEKISLLDKNQIDLKETEETITDKTENNDEIFDLILPSAAAETIDEISTFKPEVQEVKKEEENNTPIVIDITNISQEIGISTEDYNNFLNEYIDTALTLEKDLQSEEYEKRSHAIGTLAHLSDVLHLPMITEIITKIQDSQLDDKETHIKALYNTLARLTTTKIDTDNEELSVSSEAESIAKFSTDEGFGTISLDNIAPIHFDFQLEEAANDLSLPVELIEEFVHDFIGQAHTETEKMLEAYEKGDLDAIQKIGHLLKGAASNLRINPLSDTLYEIQFCEDGSKLEDFIKNYWGHFLAFENQINMTSK